MTALETRVANRKRELIEEAIEHKKNPSRAGAVQGVDHIKARLTELAHIMKNGAAKTELDDWIAR